MDGKKHPIVTSPEAPCILGIDYLRNGYFKDPKGYRWAFGIAAVETEDIRQLSTLPGLSDDSCAVGLLRVEEQQVPIATTTVHRRQYRTDRDSVIPIHEMIRKLESQGVVSKARSPFNSPIWPVRKSSGEWRLTVDYCALNEVTPPLSAAVPDMLELQYELESKAAKWYATIDIANAFFSIPLAAECRAQFAFTWKGYIDDIIVWGNTAGEVFEKGEKIIQILLKAGFAIKRSKVKGPAQEIQFLGVKWRDGRRQIPTEVINKIIAMSPPTSKKETQAFLGAIGFWRMHIPEYSQIVSPLYLVTRKKNDFHWGPEQQQAFAQIKQEIAHAVALGPVRMGPEVKNVLYSAAGNNGLSWSLWQKVPGETRGRPLGFWSRSYRGSEANYTPTEKEILAAYEGLQAASEVIGTETQLLLAPRLPVLGWMFKGKVPSTHHATDTTWSKWIALITQRAQEEEQVTRAEEAPPYNELPETERQYALFTDGSCRIVRANRKWKAAVWSPTRRVAQATEGQGGSSQIAELKAIQLALDIAEREKWPRLYLYTDSWMVANALWGWLNRWKKANWQRRGKPIWAAEIWQDIAARVEKLTVKVRHVDAHVSKSQANEEHHNNEQVDKAAKVKVSQVDLDWQHKGEVFLARWAHDASGHQGRDATYRWARDRGVDLTMDNISQVIHNCETCAAIKQAKRVAVGEDEARKPYKYDGLDSEMCETYSGLNMQIKRTLEFWGHNSRTRDSEKEGNQSRMQDCQPTASPLLPLVQKIYAQAKWGFVKSTEATALSALAPSAPGEEAKEEPKEGNYCLIPAVVTAQLEYSKPGSFQHLVEQQDVEHSGDVSPAVTPTSAGAESGAHESLSPSADEPLFLNAAEHMHTEVVKEAVLVVQRPLEEPEDPCEQKQSGDEEMGAKARAAEAESPAYVPHSPRADGLVLLDTAQSMAASAEGTESPGHTVHSQTADAPLFLDHRDFLQTEGLKRAVLMVQEPLKQPKEVQKQEGSMHEAGEGRDREPGTCPTQPHSP
ncbi:hypothetical protein DUI87_12239 [Hirundo rustica rustica]|uniref:RNase H type-1 domain-containing protein n=1 Tax=Hirundo rustica rustica TaxID=333673 RepID=A0A3M0KVB6_HIRRU|nr:hypothetical protein DUI87_12239 [Hirundo rustica rustica]